MILDYSYNAQVQWVEKKVYIKHVFNKLFYQVVNAFPSFYV